MLARAHRLTSGPDYARTIRGGRKGASRTMVVHLLVAPGGGRDSADRPRVGFVVSKAVGNAVTRNQVKRRLRELCRERLESLPASALLVVRALPAAAGTSFAALAADLDRALERALDPAANRAGRRTPVGHSA